MEPTNNLRQAIKDYKSGNGQAFDVLYNESSKYVYTCIYKVMCGNDNTQDAINDIMQDTYVEISRYITQLEDEERFLSWAGTIATRKCYAYLKKSRKYVLLNEEDTTFDTLADNDNIIPEEIMQDKEKQRLLREIINTELTEMQKLCIIAYYYNEQKQSEIARELGIPENTVKTNLSRAKAKIKDGVLDLEKKKGTKLYSIAPFMLLLFREEVYAAVVPQEITRNVLSSVSASTLASGAMASVGVEGSGAANVNAVSSGVKSAVGKAATTSIKAKIIGGVVGLVVLGAIGGAVYTVSSMKKETTWEKVYKGYLLKNEEAVGFDLNDFDGDEIPELVVKTEDEGVDVCRVENESIIRVRALLGPHTLETENAIETLDDCRIGYGMNYNEMITLRTRNGVLNDSGKKYSSPAHNLFVYKDNKLEPVKYDSNTIEEEFNTIQYTEIEEDKINERFKEFKKDGNRERVKNEHKQEDKAETEVIEESLDAEDTETESQEGTVETENQKEQHEVEVTEEEKETLRILAQFFTATRWGENLAGEEIIPTEQNVCDFIGRVANENFEYNQWAYDKYLPTRIAEEEFRQVYTADSIKEYVKSVFGVELSEINSLMLTEENGNYVTMEAQFSSGDKCVITKVIAKGDTYTVMGTDAFGEYQDIYSSEPTYISSYNFTMTLTKNEDSPFGYILNSIKYEQGEEVEAEETNKLKEILLYPENYSGYYSAISDYQNLFFALVDIDGDEVEEVMLGKAESVHPNFGPEALKIINILKYDAESNTVTDFDGDKVYEPLAVSNSFKLYDTGILMTRADMNYAYTNFWNLITGEFNEGWLWYPDDVMAGVNSEGHSKVKKQDGTEITGEEGDKLYESLMSGEELPFEWYEATEENVKSVLP